MTLGNQLSLMTTPKLEHTKSLLNLSDEELQVFNLLARRKSVKEISLTLKLSTRTVDRIIKRIRLKLNNV